MKRLLVFAFVIVCSPAVLMAQDFSPVSGKVEQIIKDKEPGWKLAIKETKVNPNVYKWESGTDFVAFSLSYTASEAEAATKLKVAKAAVPVPPSSQLKNLGDEAYLWKGGKGGFVLIQFRKANVVVHINAKSEPVAERYAKHIISAISSL